MSAATTQKVGGKALTLTWGARESHVLPLDVASSYSGLVRDVLPRMIEEHITEPGLREGLCLMLNDPRVTFELFSTAPTESADGLEEPVYPDDDWGEVVRKAEEAVSEFGMALRAEGG